MIILGLNLCQFVAPISTYQEARQQPADHFNRANELQFLIHFVEQSLIPAAVWPEVDRMAMVARKCSQTKCADLAENELRTAASAGMAICNEQMQVHLCNAMSQDFASNVPFRLQTRQVKPEIWPSSNPALSLQRGNQTCGLCRAAMFIPSLRCPSLKFTDTGFLSTCAGEPYSSQTILCCMRTAACFLTSALPADLT
jgi:hypothetical protein